MRPTDTMRALLTCGPAFEPIDGARRLTNMSSGRLGAFLADALTDAGWEVHCLRGEGATQAPPRRAASVTAFATNDDLADLLEAWSRRAPVHAVFHAAALCDFRVARVLDASGAEVRSAKVATREGRIVLELEPATKVLPRLRDWFPEACLVGWKYELAGTREDALARAWRQLRECRTDACVLNGAAYGDGFAVCRREGVLHAVEDAEALAGVLQAMPGRARQAAAIVGLQIPMGAAAV